MSLELDHLVIIAPSLAEGVEHLRACLDIDIPFGGAHPEMATHNHLLSLGDAAFLEVIAADPAAPRPAMARWFGLDDPAAIRADWEEGRRLRGWVARTRDLDGLISRHGALLGQARQVSRGSLRWRFAVRPDGTLPADGAAPCAIEWGPEGCPAIRMPELGAKLASFTLEYPARAEIAALYASLGILDPPSLAHGERLRYRAVIDTPHGPREIH
jgi:hypothetical protein